MCGSGLFEGIQCNFFPTFTFNLFSSISSNESFGGLCRVQLTIERERERGWKVGSSRERERKMKDERRNKKQEKQKTSRAASFSG